MHSRNQPNKSKLALYKSLLQFYSHLKQLYISNKVECFSYEVSVACMGVHLLRRLKEEQAWAIDKQLQVISNIMLFKTLISLRN